MAASHPVGHTSIKVLNTCKFDAAKLSNYFEVVFLLCGAGKEKGNGPGREVIA